MSVKTFIGYDLGDGESITDFVNMNTDNADRISINWQDMTMPGINTPGRAVPTVFGYDDNNSIIFAQTIAKTPQKVHDVHINFKRRPSDLMPDVIAFRRDELVAIADNAAKTRIWPTTVPELNSQEMLAFRDAVVTFTNAVFENSQYLERVQSVMNQAHSTEINFYVGHPTIWDDLDAAVYKLILSQSVLGKGRYADRPSMIGVAQESRAAYLFAKSRSEENRGSHDNYFLPKDTCALLIDVGSSTIDVTAVKADSADSVHHSGNNYLGVRCIDFMMRNLGISKIKRNSGDYERLLELQRNNPGFLNSLVLAFREAKENFFTAGSGQDTVISVKGVYAELSPDEINRIIDTQEIVPVLVDDLKLPREKLTGLVGKSWRQGFRQFLRDEKAALAAKNLKAGRIIITGGASWMPVVREVVAEVFNDTGSNNIMLDMDPSRTISKGLALIGPYSVKSEMFREDARKLCEERLPVIIERNIPSLAERISTVIRDIAEDVVMSRVREWRSGRILTINGMKAKIESDLSEKGMKSILDNSPKYQEAVNGWMSDVLGADIAGELQALCNRYSVKGFTLGQLNIFSGIKGINVAIGTPDMPGMDALFTILGMIVGVVTAIMLPTIIGVLIGIIASISTTIAAILVNILLTIPVWGWGILLVVGGIALINAAIDGAEAAKKQLMDYLSGCDLPQWVRKKMTDEKMRAELTKSNIAAEIKRSLNADANKRKMAADMSVSLRRQVESKAREIQYAIESR